MMGDSWSANNISDCQVGSRDECYNLRAENARLTADLAARTQERDAALASCRTVDLERYAMEQERDAATERADRSEKARNEDLLEYQKNVTTWTVRALGAEETSQSLRKERDGLLKIIYGTQDLYRHYPVLAAWGHDPEKPEHLVSQITYILNLYSDCCHTLGQIVKQRDAAIECAEKAERECDGLAAALSKAKNWLADARSLIGVSGLDQALGDPSAILAAHDAPFRATIADLFAGLKAALEALGSMPTSGTWQAAGEEAAGAIHSLDMDRSHLGEMVELAAPWLRALAKLEPGRMYYGFKNGNVVALEDQTPDDRAGLAAEVQAKFDGMIARAKAEARSEGLLKAAMYILAEFPTNDVAYRELRRMAEREMAAQAEGEAHA